MCNCVKFTIKPWSVIEVNVHLTYLRVFVVVIMSGDNPVWK